MLDWLLGLIGRWALGVASWIESRELERLPCTVDRYARWATENVNSDVDVTADTRVLEVLVQQLEKVMHAAGTVRIELRLRGKNGPLRVTVEQEGELRPNPLTST